MLLTGWTFGWTTLNSLGMVIISVGEVFGACENYKTGDHIEQLLTLSMTVLEMNPALLTFFNFWFFLLCKRFLLLISKQHIFVSLTWSISSSLPQRERPPITTKSVFWLLELPKMSSFSCRTSNLTSAISIRVTIAYC